MHIQPLLVVGNTKHLNVAEDKIDILCKDLPIIGVRFMDFTNKKEETEEFQFQVRTVKFNWESSITQPMTRSIGTLY